MNVYMINTFDPQSLLTYDNIDADSTEVYDATKAYSEEDLVRLGDRIYKSMADNNQGNNPTESPLKWNDIAPINEVAVFDDYPSTISWKAGNDPLVFEFDKVDFMKLLSMEEIHGKSVKIELIDNDTGAIAFEETKILSSYREPENAWEMKYRWDKDKEITDYHLIVDQAEYNQKLRITIEPRNGKAGVGFLDFGGDFILGCRQIDGLSFTVTAEADFVYFRHKIQPKAFPLVKTMSVKLTLFENKSIVQEEVEQRIGTRCVIIVEGSENIESYQVVGYYQGFDITEAYNSQAVTGTLEIKKIENTRS